MNLMYLGGALEDSSYSVKIIDDDLEKLGVESLTKLLSKFNPDMIGITSTTSTIKRAHKYVNLSRKILPDSLIIIGGPHATFLPSETLKSNKFLDAVVIGEGEETIVELADKFCNRKKGQFADIKGIAYNDLKNGNIKLNSPRPLIKDLDTIPFPARHLVPFKLYGTTQDLIERYDYK